MIVYFSGMNIPFILWLFNIAMENGPVIDGLPGFTFRVEGLGFRVTYLKLWFSTSMWKITKGYIHLPTKLWVITLGFDS